MNTRIGQWITSLLIVAATLFWSVSVLATETGATNAAADPQKTSAIRAADAHTEAAEAAAESINEAIEVDLDLAPIGLTSVSMDSDVVTVAAN